MESKRSEFQLDKEVIYLNCAYQSPLSKRVISAGVEGVLAKANPQRITSSDFFYTLEILKNNFAKLIKCNDPQRIAYHPSASYGFAIVANNLPVKEAGKIIMPASQFPSNYYAFENYAKRNRATIEIIKPVHQFENRAKIWNDDIINAIDDQTVCVTIDHAHWQDGTVFDLLRIKEKCMRHQALLIIDGTQSVGALPIDIEILKPDALICAGYKFLLGPYGSGLSYYGEFFDKGNPIEYNWINRLHSDDFTSLTNYQVELRPKAFRYNVGEFSNYIHLSMLNEAILQLLEWKPESIQDYCTSISRNFLETIHNKGYLFDPQGQARHLFGIYNQGDMDPKILSKKLQEDQIFVSVRGDAIRISPNVYNSEEDLMRLAEIL